MIRRRRFVAAGLLAVALPVRRAAGQERRVGRVGVLGPGAGPDLDAFQQAMRELGWEEGRSVVYQRRWGRRPEQQRAAALSLVTAGVDLIFAPGTGAALAAKRASGSIPIVFAVVPDPVTAGLVASLARPGGNATGLTTLHGELHGQRLRILGEALPRLTRVGFVLAESDAGHAAGLDEMRAAARQLGLDLRTFDVRDRQRLDLAFHELRREGADAVIVDSSPLMAPHRAHAIALAARERMPVMYTAVADVAAGGLMAYAASVADNHRRAAVFVDRILRGARPADLPVEPPARFELALNLTTAAALGLTLPPALLRRADRLIR